MYANSILAVSGLISLVAAIPMQHEHHRHEKKDYVWVTETEEAVVTVPVTQTVWLEPGETAPVDHHYGGRPSFSPHSSSSPASSSSTSTPAPAPYVPPVSSSTSHYVAPASSSSSSSSSVPPPALTTISTPPAYVPPPAPTTSSTTSEYVAPPPAPTSTSSSSTYVPPPAPATTETPASTWVAPSSSSAAPASAASVSAPSAGNGLSYGMAASGKSYTGDVTYYDVGLGACGITSSASEHIVAVSHVTFDSYGTANPNANPICGKQVSITSSSGSQVLATVVDRCVGCTEDDLDLSTGLFQTVYPAGDGRVHGVKWSFV